MRLLKLTANKSSFKPVTFNRSGLSFVLAQRKSPDNSARNRTKTYNGVGKSLLIELIHYCLGSNANDSFKKHLSDWIFTLSVEIDGQESVITRSAGRPSEITIDGDDISLTKLRERLGKAAFEILPGIKGLTFRSLVAPFIRSGGGAYERFDRASPGEAHSEYYALVRNCYLLGLDLSLVQRKHSLRMRQVTLKKTMKQLESDPLFSELLEDETAGIELTQLREDEAKFESDLNSFKVADDYTEIEKEANSLKRQLDATRREVLKIDESIAQIDRSLKTKGDLDPRVVERIYNEAQVAFPERVQLQIDAVLSFQHELAQNRVFRLTADRQELVSERTAFLTRQKELAARLDDRLGFLGSHVALDEYRAVNEKLNEIRQRIAKLEASNEQRTKVNRELKAIDRDLAEEAIRTDEYLDHAKDLVEESNSRFRSFTKPLYGNRASGITVTNDSGENLTRYRLDAHIASDAAEGINEAKIFCYDLMVTTLRRRHRVQFLVHDSTLFGPIDSRQRFSMLQLVDAVAEKFDIQYIAMLNEHDVTSMQPMDEEGLADFEHVFRQENVVLRLTDQSPKDRLLGIEIDMDYTAKMSEREELSEV
jgi:uncharacterized protein YydD (DUF2326 family)